MGCTACTEPLCLYKGDLYLYLLVPLLMKEYSYTSAPPMGRTACTEPLCLYKGDLYLLPSSAVGHERVELYLYSPYGPYGLYRASVPVQG